MIGNMCDARHALMCSMLFTTVILVTAEAPTAVPEVFQRMWQRYEIFRRTKKARAASREKFWEIDMTKFEP